MKEGVSRQFPWEHFPGKKLTRGSFAKVSSLRASSSLFRVASDGPRENALASPFACRSRVTSHGQSLRELARRLDSIRQEQLLLSLNPDFLWSKDVLI